MISKEECIRCNKRMRDFRIREMKKRKRDFVLMASIVLVVFGYLIWQVNRNIESEIAEASQIVYKPIFQEVPGEPIYLDKEIEVIDVRYKESMYNYIKMDLPTNANGEFKTYMDYRTITNKSSKQWHLQQLATTNENGFRVFNDKYLIAVGSYYSKEVGKEFRITLSDGITFNAIVGDLKMDKHTDSNNQYVPMNGNIIEFIVDIDKLDPLTARLGDVSNSGLKGKIVSIEEEVIQIEEANRN